MNLVVFLLFLSVENNKIDTLDTSYELEKVSITASRYKIDIFRLPFDVSIMSKDEAPINERLLKTCGAAILNYGNLSSLSIRGSTSEQVGISLNGVEMNLPQNGIFDISLVPGYFIGEGYIIGSSGAGLQQSGNRGNTAAFYTKEKEKSFFLTNASFKKIGIGAIYPFSYIVSGLYLEQSENRYPYKDEFGRVFYQENAEYTHLANYLLINLPVRVSIFSGYRNADIPAKLGSISGIPHKKEGIGAGSFLYDTENFRFNGSAKYSYLNFEDTVFGKDIHKNFTADLSGDYKLDKREFGLKIKGEGVSSTKIGTNKRLIIGFQFLDRINFKKVSSLPAISVEHSYRELYNLSFILPFFVHLKNNFGTYHSISYGYRYPTMNELYWPEDNFAAGNPDLKSESNLTMETGLRYLSFYFLKLGCFCKIGERIIIWRPGADGKWRPLNTGYYLARGANVELALDTPLKLSSGYSFVSAKVDDGVLSYRPEHSIILNLERYGLYTESMFFIRRPANPSGLLFLDDIFLINFGYHIKKKLSSFILELNPKIKNILDKNYEFVEGYPQPGREYEITIKIKEAK